MRACSDGYPSCRKAEAGGSWCEHECEAMTADWWDELLAERFRDGQRDAEHGRFESPYPGSQDPQDEDENLAYRRGFDQRRRELGDAFRWPGC